MTDVGAGFISNNGPSMASLLMAGTSQGSDTSKLIMAMMAHSKSDHASSKGDSKEDSEEKKVTVNVNGQPQDDYGTGELGKSLSSAASSLSNIQGGKSDPKKEAPETDKKADGAETPPPAGGDEAATTPPETSPPAETVTPAEPPAAS
jgi:hypothetical protein